MDNISHALVSLAAGEILHRALPAEATESRQNLRQKLILFTAAAAGNFPDLDLVLYPLLNKPLGYLLHHRGHSHTILGACLEALMLLALIYGLWPRARELIHESRVAKKAVAAAMTLGFALHLSMDWLNSYGVHPFYPLDSHWYYGDLVFIIEPVFWIAFGVPLAFLTRRFWLRYPLLILVIAVPLYAFVKGFLTWPAVASLSLIAVALGWQQSRESVRGFRGLAAAFIVGLGFIVLQGVMAHAARANIRIGLQILDPNAKVLDEALTAYPTNPLCWNYVTVEENQSLQTYRLRGGQMSLNPSLIAPQDCPKLFGATDKMMRLNSMMIETLEESQSLSTLQSLARSNCHLNAWLRFSRMPLVSNARATDLRFARGAGRNFSTLEFQDFKDEPCSSWIPQWDRPREDLLAQ